MKSTHKPLRLITLILSFGLLFSACNIINPLEPIPSYIYIDKIELNDSVYNYHGSISNKITDAWVIVNNKQIGTFELPALIPVLDSGYVNIIVSPGILVNGINTTRGVYPMYTTYLIDKKLLTAGKIDTLKPKVRYSSYMEFLQIDDFEKGFNFETSLTSDTSFLIDSTVAFEGQRCLAFKVTADRPILDCRTSKDLAILGQGRNSFIEMDYKCNQNFSIKVDVLTPNQGSATIDFFVLNKKESWNKIYINLTQLINAQPPGSVYRIRFVMNYNSAAGNTGEVFIDNFKVVYTN